MEQIGDLINRRLNQHKIGGAARASQLIFTANNMLKEHFDSDETEIRAMKLKDGILYIGTASSVWSQELWGYKEKLLRGIHEKYGEKSVLKIVIKGLTSF